jgi:hypothetical protein
MAKRVLRDCVIEVAGVDFSDHINSVEVSLEKEEVDTTNFSGGGKERAHGLKEDSFTLNFQQDFDAAEVDATLWPLFNNETEFTVKVKPTVGATSPTNPQYVGTCVLMKYMPLSGKVGELSETKVDFPAQRSGITRLTA